VFLDPPVDECQADITAGRDTFNKKVDSVASEPSLDFCNSTTDVSSTVEQTTELSSACLQEPTTDSAPQEQNTDLSSSALGEQTTEVSLVAQEQHQGSLKRKLEHQGLQSDLWSNGESDPVPSVKRWRCELQEDGEGESVDLRDELRQVSDSEEGSDVIELPVVDEDSCLVLEDNRSILCDSDLQMFPPSDLKKDSSENPSDKISFDEFNSTSVADVTEVLMEIGLETPVVNNWGLNISPDGAQETTEMRTDDDHVEFDRALYDKEVDDRSTPRDVLEIIPDLDFMDGLEILTEELAELEAKSKVEPNNNVDDFLSDLLINLP